MRPSSINELREPEFDEFIAYLNDHLSDNGNSSIGYFQPIARKDSKLSPERAQRFCRATQLEVGRPGWKRIWIARSPVGEISGHVDLRAHPDPYTDHRCVLGIGVDRAHRRQRLGQTLLDHCIQWAIAYKRFEWVDLQVLTVNQPAIRLYKNNGFRVNCEISGMFDIDGSRFSQTLMSRRLHAAA